MKKKLYMEFVDANEDVMTFSIDDPVADLDSATLQGEMNAIVEANVFDSRGVDLTAPKAGYIIEQNRVDIFS